MMIDRSLLTVSKRMAAELPFTNLSGERSDRLSSSIAGLQAGVSVYLKEQAYDIGPAIVESRQARRVSVAVQRC